MRLIIGAFLVITACAASRPPQTGVDTISVGSNQSNYEVDSVALFLIEQSVNSNELKQYYHFEMAKRESMKLILNTSSPISGVSIKCFGRQMELIKNTNRLNHPFALELVNIDRDRSKASLEFRYAIESISFKAAFEFVDKKWIKRSTNILEN